MIARNFTNYALQMAGVRKPSGNRSYETEDLGSKQIYLQGLCLDVRIDHDSLGRNLFL